MKEGGSAFNQGMERNGNGIMIPKWLVILGPIIGTLLGASISYGILKSEVAMNTESRKEMSVYIRSIDSRLSRIEGALSVREKKQ